MSVLIEPGTAAAMTAAFLAIIVVLTLALISLFCMLEQSPRMIRARGIVLRVVDGRTSVSQMRRNSDK